MISMNKIIGNSLRLETLKPCPFCGGQAVLDEMPFLEGYIRVECSDCHASTETFVSGEINEITRKAVERWNKRLNKDNDAPCICKVIVESKVMFSNRAQLEEFLSSFGPRLSCSPNIWIEERRARQARGERAREIAVRTNETEGM